ncbi:MAG: energy transducer TonB, partial [Acidobacteriota bacterium]|nr:energy transducer TonB [Acidobacteriota bacterium]
PETKPAGRVQFSAIILKSGQLDSVELYENSATAAKIAAIADLRQWRFVPALRDGLPVDVEVVLEIPYQ